MSIVDESVENGVGKGGIADDVVSGVDGYARAAPRKRRMSAQRKQEAVLTRERT